MSPEPIGIGDLSRELEKLAHIATTASTDDTDFMQQFADALKRDFATRAGYSAQFDSNPVADDPFDAMSHEDIWAKAGSLDPATIDQTSNNWRALGFEAARSAAAFSKQIADQIGTNWQGPAADAAGQGVQKYANSSVELMLSADTLATKVMESYGGVTSTKAMLPPPVPYAGGEKILDVLTWGTRTFLPGDMKSIQHAHEEAEEAARSVMKTQYAPVIRQAAVQVPVLPPAVNPLNGTDTPITSPGLRVDPRMDSTPLPYSGLGSDGSGSGVSGQGTPGQGTAGQGTSGTAPGATDSQAQSQTRATPQDTATQASNWAPSESPSAGQQAGSGTSGPGGQGTSGPGGQSAGSQGAGSNSTSGSPYGGSTATGQGTQGGRSASGGTGGRFGGAGGGSALGSAQGGGLGSSAGGVASGGAAAAGRVGAPGMGGMGGMAPVGGRGGAGGDDDVHATPGYLIDAVNGDALIGSLPLVAPPVLGE